jgi:PAS domain S-box-containing protein
VIARWALSQEQRSFLSLQKTYELMISTDELVSSLAIAENGVLGYVLTDEPSYLKRYATRKELAGQIDRLRTQVENDLVENDPKQRAQVGKLDQLIQEKVRALGDTVRERDSSGLDAARNTLLTDQSKQLMAEIERIITEMKNAEQNTLARFSQSRQTRMQTGLATLASSALLASFCLVLGQIMLSGNISRRQRAEEGLQRSERRFEALCEQAPVGIYETDPQGRCIYINSWWSTISGLSTAESLGHAWEKVLHPDDWGAVFKGWRSAIVQGAWWEYRIITPDGEIRWIRASGGPIYSAHGKLTGYVGTLEDITERKQADRTIQKSRQELRALAGRLINAQEEERKRISRELHDDLNQKLALLAFDTGSLVLRPPSSVEDMHEPLRHLQARVVQLSEDVRQISHRLHPTVLDDLGLTAALSELCEEFSAKGGIQVLFQQEAVPESLPIGVASCLYRVAQEALHNVLKHARANLVRLIVSGSSEGIQMQICDNGVGFDSEAEEFRPGLGIVSMKERVLLVQGEFSIDAEPGRGTKVEVFVAVPKPEG